MDSEILELFKQSKLPAAKYDTYFDAYQDLFAKYKGKDITFVEVGVLGGGSLEAFKKYFGKGSRIIGIDLNPTLKDFLKGKGMEIFVGDQVDPLFWEAFYREVGKVDVLLDDGGHTNQQTWTTFISSLRHINDGGLIAIEDTHASYIRDFGNPSKDSLMSKAKDCIDEINYRSCRIYDNDRRFKQPNKLKGLNISDYVHSIKTYESITAFSIDQSRCKKSVLLNFGSEKELPQGETPEDFRYRGIEKNTPKLGIRSRVKKIVKKILLRP